MEMRKLFGANNTVQLFSTAVRWAGQPRATVSLHMVEQGTVGVADSSCLQGLLVLIHTLVHGAMMIMSPVSAHEVAIELPGPVWGAAGLGWDHDYGGSGGHVAHSTWYVVVVC